MTNTLYTVRDCNDDAIGAHLTVEEAAIEILTYDGAHYAIERVNDEWQLFTRRANNKWDLRHPVEFSTNADKEEATLEMFQNVVDRASIDTGWKVEAITDEAFKAEIMDMIEQLDEDPDQREGFEEALAEWRAM